MRWNRRFVFVAGVCLLAPVAAVAAGADYAEYLGQTPRSTNIVAEKTAGMVAELRFEVQKILNAGPLAPLRMAYADIPFEAYWLYYEPGRVVTTLAYAYPHVTEPQRAGIRAYVRRLFEDPRHQPWAFGILGKTDGARRELSGIGCVEGRYFDPQNSPTLHTLYGVWLYGDRSGDWEAIRPHWANIKTRYAKGLAGEPRLYGQMSAHVAVARLAGRFGDAQTQAAASGALREDFDAGKDVAAIAARLARTRFRRFAEPRNRRAFPGETWVFLDACPEVMRFVADNAKADAIGRADAMRDRYPKWWLLQAPYSTRWTGDEGVGVTPELIGMIYPVERWVKGTQAAELASYMRSVPLGIGDCYWLEALVQTVEAFGDVTWEAVK